ncbi:MAG: hypothetical protein IJW46_00020 [Clostridia bacterium]|nr:hypothetical protein [Clostridia bacterium]
MKRKLIIVLLILLFISIAIGTSPIIDYFYSLADSASTTEALTTVPDTAADDTVSPKAVLFAVILSAVTVVASFAVYLRKRKG